MNEEHTSFARKSRRFRWKGRALRIVLMHRERSRVNFPGDGLNPRKVNRKIICLHGIALSEHEHHTAHGPKCTRWKIAPALPMTDMIG